MSSTVTGAQRRFDKWPMLAVFAYTFWETDGATAVITDTDKLAGNLTKVERLTSTGGEEFYRLTWDTMRNDARSVVGGKVEVANDIDAGDDFVGVVPRDGDAFFSVPLVSPARQNSIQFDVAVRDGGTRALTNQVPAGRRVYVSLVFDESYTPPRV